MKTGVQTPVFAVKTDKSKEAVGSHAQNKNEASAKADTSFTGPSDGIRTHGLLVPNHRKFVSHRCVLWLKPQYLQGFAGFGRNYRFTSFRIVFTSLCTKCAPRTDPKTGKPIS